MVSRLFYLFHFTIVVLSCFLVFAEVFGVKPGILAAYTEENGFFELASAAFLFFSGLYLLFRVSRFSTPKIRYLFIAIGLVFILGALEELSWGQHLFGFESGEMFSENIQQETNLHNFIPAWIFGLVVNLVFYVVFVFTPILIYLFEDKLFSGKFDKYKKAVVFVPSVHLVLVFCFGFALQKYFIVDTYTDTLALVLSLLLVAIVAVKEKSTVITMHLMLIVLIAGFFAFSHEIFSYKNLQYEIREFVFIYAMVYWLIQVVNLLQRPQQAH